MTYATIQTTTMNANHTHPSLRRRLAALMLLSLGLLATQTAHAQVPQRLAYQSLVTDLNGEFLPAGPYQVTFRLYTDVVTPGWDDPVRAAGNLQSDAECLRPVGSSAVLVEGPMAAGRHEVRFQADHLSSGLYLVRMQAGAFSEVHRMTLLK